MRKISLHIILLLFTIVSYGQTSMSFHHLGNTTYQNSFLNPAYVPDGKVFIGLPAISGIHLNVNNKFSYHDFVSEEGGQNVVDLDKFLKSLQPNNMVHTTAEIGLFHLGISPSPGKMISFFANERIESDVFYQKALIEYVIEGNGVHLDEEMKLGKTRMNFSWYREYGVGFTTKINHVSVGARAKYLQGIANASTDPRFTANLTTKREDYSLALELQNASLRTSGFTALNGDVADPATYAIANANSGVGLDLGMSWDMDRRFSFSTSIVDLGFISWKDAIKNHSMSDTSMVFEGINLKEPDMLEETIQDSLIDRFKNRKTETYETYSTILSPKAYFTGVYNISKKGSIVGTAAARYNMGQVKLALGGGYKHQVGEHLVASVNVTRLPQQFLNAGAALALRGGPLQLYVAADQMFTLDMSRFQAIDLRLGVNFIFGKHGNSNSVSPVRVPTKNRSSSKGKVGSFLGKKVRIKGDDKIYQVIDEQSPRSKRFNSLSGDPKPTRNTNPTPILNGDTDIPTKNPNRNPIKSDPPAGVGQKTNSRGVISVTPQIPSKNPNLGRVKSAKSAASDQKPIGRGAISIAPNKPTENRNLRRNAHSSRPSFGRGLFKRNKIRSSSSSSKSSNNANAGYAGNRSVSGSSRSSNSRNQIFAGNRSVSGASKPSKNYNFGNFTKKSKPIPGGSNRRKIRKPKGEGKRN